MPEAGIEPGWVRRTARDAGYAPTGFERAYRLAVLLREIGRHPWLRDRLVLKGGTCINFFHDELPRLSVDMDLDYIGSIERVTMMQQRPRVEAILRELVTAYGYEWDVETGSYIGLKVRLRYINIHGHRDSIRADLNFVMRVAFYGVERHDLPDVFDLDPAQVPALPLEAVYGGKLKALATRAEARDLFDAARLFTGPLSHDPRKLRAAFLFYGYMDDTGLGLLNLDNISAITDEDIRRHLYPMLRAAERPTAEALRAAILPRITTMLDRDENEIAYGEELEAGRHEPSLLFGDIPIPSEMVHHPAALWRARHPHGKLHGEESVD